jgi:ParB family transcriptional regulator, chromosome partitioning protein
MRYIYDTNIFIYYLAGEPIVDSLFAEDFLNLHDILMSPIVRWESYVKNRLPLLNLPKELLFVLEQGSIEYTKAKAIARIKDEKQRKSLLKAAIAQDLSLTQIKEKIAKLKAAEVQSDEGRTDKKATYPQRLKEIYIKAKKVKSWDDPEKQQEFEALLEKLEKLL